ncbi:MAG: DotA/TraY family protein [Rhodobacteraceae bacterium]|nr:DotA/TraY family protein [Paracoccaceae bacterium]
MNATDTDDKGLLSKINGKAVFRYAMKPDIMPRLRSLGMHFGHFAYLIALVLNSARLIPQHHQVLHSVNIGKYSVRQVLAIAANNITWSWRNIDQIAIFGAVTVGLIMVVIQAVVIAAYAFLGTAQAASPSSISFFTTPEDKIQTDVVLIMLEQTFGANLNFFGAAREPLGTPVYEGLQAVLGFYSMAMMVVAVIIVLYYIMTVVGEAAKSGTPFGQRFNSLWAPIRLVIALGLLVPLGSGLNSAQYITLQAAKMGSGLGTMIWATFVDKFTEPTNIASMPERRSMIELVSRIFLNEVCAASFNQIERGNGREVKIFQELGNTSQLADFSSVPNMISLARMYSEESIGLSWDPATEGDPVDDHTCGYMSVNLTEFDVYSEDGEVGTEGGTYIFGWHLWGPDLSDKIGVIHTKVKQAYVREIKAIADAVRPAAEAIAKVRIDVNADPEFYWDESKLDFIPDLLTSVALQTSQNINNTIASTYEDITNAAYGNRETMVSQGWGAAGLWYSNIGKINQKYMEAISSAIPTLNVIYSGDIVTNNERSLAGWVLRNSRYGISGASTTLIEETINFSFDKFAQYIASGVPKTSPLYADARLESANSDGESQIAKMVFAIFGASSLYDLKDNPSLDPMARITAGGHSIVSGALVAFGVGAAASGVSIIKGDSAIGNIAGGAASIAFAIATIGLFAGVMLAYVLPIIPFVYFAFAVMGWILEIFEAVVAMPLWALAHLRIDGEGMPGDAALQGYQLLLMIIIRPALIVMGLIGGYVIFGAAMYYFTTLFNSAVSITRDELVGGQTGFMGVMVYTMIFVFLSYNIAIMCFKMVDDVPKGMLRWMGSSAQPFGDSRGDPIGGSREVIIGAVAAGSTLSRGVSRSIKGDETGKDGFKRAGGHIKASRGGSGSGGGSSGSSGGSSAP